MSAVSSVDGFLPPERAPRAPRSSDGMAPPPRPEDAPAPSPPLAAAVGAVVAELLQAVAIMALATISPATIDVRWATSHSFVVSALRRLRTGQDLRAGRRTGRIRAGHRAPPILADGRGHPLCSRPGGRPEEAANVGARAPGKDPGGRGGWGGLSHVGRLWLGLDLPGRSQQPAGHEQRAGRLGGPGDRLNSADRPAQADTSAGRCCAQGGRQRAERP